jgi:cellulose biosynthesis protein BcsQ
MTSRSRPSIAVIGAHAIVDPLRAAGYSVLAAGATDTPTVAAAVKAEAAAGRPFVVLVGLLSWGGVDPATRAWLSVQVGAGRRVLGMVSDQADSTVEGIAGTRTLALPATVDELMANYGAPPVGGTVGNAVVGLDGSVTPVGPQRQNREPEPEPEAQSEPEADPWDDESTGFDTTPVPIRPGVEVPRPAAVRPAQPVRVAGAAALGEMTVERSVGPERAQSALVVGEPCPAPEGRSWPPEGTWGRQPDVVESFQFEPQLPLRPGTACDGPLLEAFPTSPPSTDSGGRAAQTVPSQRRVAPTLVVLAGKGGVGKSSCAAAVASRAASSGVDGLRRVLLVDASRGQGDISRLLRVAGAGLPSVYDAAISGNPAIAVCFPDQLNSARPAGLGVVEFGVVLAPTDDQADPVVVTPEVYRSVIHFARAHADLVVVDTQIVEAVDTSGLIDHLVIPLLVDGAWGLGIADQSAPGFDNLVRRLNRFSQAGVNNSRLMIGFNRLRADTTINDEALRRTVAPWATYVGAAANDPEIASSLDLAQLPPPGPYRELVDAVLHRVTGLAVFSPTGPLAQSLRRRWRHRLAWPSKERPGRRAG